MSDSAEELNIYSVGCYTFTLEEIESLMKGCSTITAKKGTPLYQANEGEKYVYFLRQGRLKLHTLYSDGTSRSSAYTEAPALVGIINVLPGHQTINDCTAVTACTLVQCPSDRFLDRVRELGLMEKLFQYAIGMSRHIYSCLNTLLTEDRWMLVDVLRNQQHLSLQETADYIGCSRVHVSRICKQLEEQRREKSAKEISPV